MLLEGVALNFGVCWAVLADFSRVREDIGHSRRGGLVEHGAHPPLIILSNPNHSVVVVFIPIPQALV